MSFDELNKTDLGYNGFTDFEAGAQSRQAEIDELKKKVDVALRYVIDHGGYDDLTHVINILKGEKQ